jgi:hypothetical protein
MKINLMNWWLFYENKMGTYTHLFYNNNGFGHIFIKDNMYCGVCMIYGHKKSYGKIVAINETELDNLVNACQNTINKLGQQSNPTEFLNLIEYGTR